MSYFLKKNSVGILLIIIVLFLLLVLTSVNQVEFQQNKPNEIKKVVLYETGGREGFKTQPKLENQLNSNVYDPRLCDNSAQYKNKACNSKKDQKTCTSHNCCIWATLFKSGGDKGAHNCLAGNIDGPENHDDKKITDEWYYKNNLYSRETRKAAAVAASAPGPPVKNYKIQPMTEHDKKQEAELQQKIKEAKQIMKSENEIKDLETDIKSRFKKDQQELDLRKQVIKTIVKEN